MSDTKWTEGPWHIPDNEVCLEVRSSDKTWIASVQVADDCDEALANAHLVAAAPDLYEALSECYKWLEVSAEGERATRMALAALDKARGESKETK